MCRDDRLVKSLGSFQVVVETIHPRFGQPFGFFFCQDPQGSADLHPDLGLDPAGGLADDIQVPVAGTAGGRHHAILPGSRVLGLLGPFHQRFDGHQGILGGRCLVLGGLGAKAAILGASARFGVLEHVDSNFIAVEMSADPVSGLNDGQGFFSRGLKDKKAFFVGRWDLLDGFVGENFPKRHRIIGRCPHFLSLVNGLCRKRGEV